MASVSGLGSSEPPVTIVRRNYKAVSRSDLEEALSRSDWSALYAIRDVEDVLAFITANIIEALDLICPPKRITVKKGHDLYLANDTLRLMAVRDIASGAKYKALRNRVVSMVKRDKIMTNLGKLRSSPGDPKLPWRLANQALGKQAHSKLPAHLSVNGVDTIREAATAAAMGNFYVKKIDKLRASLPIPPFRPCPPRATAGKFSFSFTNAAKVTKIIRQLKPTEAVGLDGIPVSILKKGIEVLASPLAHLVNMSMASRVFPSGFKLGKVIPVHKGKGKCCLDPASYRPVSILVAMSKVLEVAVKDDLEKFFATTVALPTTQFGFRPGRSTVQALASAHASWTTSIKEDKKVGIMAFDLSAAFDTISKDQLLPKLQAMGIGGTPLKWFDSYMTGGCQCTGWNDTLSNFNDVKFGVRQGSILGPLLFLALVADMPAHLGLGNLDHMGYAEDTCVWASGTNLETVRSTSQHYPKRIPSRPRLGTEHQPWPVWPNTSPEDDICASWPEAF
jgi:hypothetical protein